MEQDAEKASVNRNIVVIRSQFLPVTCEGSFGCNCASIIAGASRRARARIVRRIRRNISSRRGDIRITLSCPDCSFWTRVRNIFWKSVRCLSWMMLMVLLANGQWFWRPKNDSGVFRGWGVRVTSDGKINSSDLTAQWKLLHRFLDALKGAAYQS